MKISLNKVAVIRYTLRVEGEIIDSADQEFDYIHGTHTLLPKFEEMVEGKQEGDNFSFTVSCDDAYGPYNPDERFDIPKTSFSVNGEIREDLLTVGRMIPMLNGQGEVVRAIIVEVKENEVTVDFNHPLAGKDLDFEGCVLSVRKATEKELKEGLHGEFLPPEEHHCCHGGGKGCCHSEGHGEDGEHHCCHGEGHEDGGCCCHGEGEGHKEGGCCCNKEN